MKDRSDNPSHHERTLLPRSYIALLRQQMWVACGIRSPRPSSGGSSAPRDVAVLPHWKPTMATLNTDILEGNVLFNDALNTFYLRLYGVRHMVKDHSDSGRGNPLHPHRLLFPINSKGSFICIIPHTTVFVTPVVEHWLEREIAQ